MSWKRRTPSGLVLVPGAAAPTVEVPLIGRRVLRVSAWEGSVWIRSGVRLGEGDDGAIRHGAVVSVPVARTGDLREAIGRVVREAARAASAERP